MLLMSRTIPWAGDSGLYLWRKQTEYHVCTHSFCSFLIEDIT